MDRKAGELVLNLSVPLSLRVFVAEEKDIATKVQRQEETQRKAGK